MGAYKHILLPTDGSTLSRRATRAAIALARTQKARITAMHVIAPYMPMPYVEGFIPEPAEIYSAAQYKRRAEAEAEKLLGEVREQARAAKVLCATRVVSDPRPWQAILRAARSQRCDLIVMASHGRRGLEGVLLGSETQRVVTHSTRPVLVVR